jgi:NADH-quinone oxidoreductase subunit J
MHLNGALIAFYVIALAILICAVLMLTFRKVIYMALTIGGIFLGCAALYIMLGAEFVGVAQILIYAGAITILIMFAIMLTNHEATEPPTQWNLRNVASGIGAALLAVVILLVIRSTSWQQPGTQDLNNGLSNPVAIGEELFKSYAIPFEIVSLLLIVGLVGAVILAQERKEDEE